MEFKHISIMLSEVLDGLNIKPDGIYVDGTLGGAGHSSEILKRLSDKGRLIGIDQDRDALKASAERLKSSQQLREYEATLKRKRNRQCRWNTPGPGSFILPA